jgi:hypothetical protein
MGFAVTSVTRRVGVDILAGNPSHREQLLQRRVHMIPFDVTIPLKEPISLARAYCCLRGRATLLFRG